MLELSEDLLGRARESQIDVFGGSGPRQPKFEDQATLEHDGVPECVRDTSEEAIEHEELTAPAEIGPRR